MPRGTVRRGVGTPHLQQVNHDVKKTMPQFLTTRTELNKCIVTWLWSRYNLYLRMRRVRFSTKTIMLLCWLLVDANGEARRVLHRRGGITLFPATNLCGMLRPATDYNPKFFIAVGAAVDPLSIISSRRNVWHARSPNLQNTCLRPLVLPHVVVAVRCRCAIVPLTPPAHASCTWPGSARELAQLGMLCGHNPQHRDMGSMQWD